MKIPPKFWPNSSPSESMRYERLPHDGEPNVPLSPSCSSLIASFLSGVGITTLVTISAVIFWLHPLQEHECAMRTSSPSPVMQHVQIKYHTQQFNGSFFKETVFRGDASPEVDAAWEAMGVNYRPGIIDEDEARAAGLRADQVRLSEKYGGGFVAYVDGLHQLHCLNLLRKSLPWNIEYYEALGTGPFVNNRTILKTHVTHCLDSVRQQLMCSVDTGLLGEVWYRPTDPDASRTPKPFVDFSTQHKCRNFDDIRRWAEERQMPDMETFPEGYLRMPRAGDRIYDGAP